MCCSKLRNPHPFTHGTACEWLREIPSSVLLPRLAFLTVPPWGGFHAQSRPHYGGSSTTAMSRGVVADAGSCTGRGTWRGSNRGLAQECAAKRWVAHAVATATRSAWSAALQQPVALVGGRTCQASPVARAQQRHITMGQRAFEAVAGASSSFFDGLRGWFSQLRRSFRKKGFARALFFFCFNPLFCEYRERGLLLLDLVELL
jgi:hypothetical protein